jgi:hypothetical protein
MGREAVLRRWLADRPAFVALAALLAPALVSVVGLGFTALLPDARLANSSRPPLSSRLPLLSTTTSGSTRTRATTSASTCP